MPTTLGEALFARGFRRTVWVSFDDPRVHEFGAFDPAAPLLDFHRRYGSLRRKGDLVGERYSPVILEAVVRHPSNPLGIEGNQAYGLRPGEEYDVRMVSGGGDAAVYDTFISATYRALFPAPPPPAPPPPTSEAQRVAELRALLAQALAGFQAAWARPGIAAFVASEFVGLVLLRAVQLYRKVVG